MRKITVIGLLFLALFSAGCTTVERVPKDFDAREAARENAEMGLKYFQIGEYEVALEKLQRALDFDDNYGPAHHYLALLYDHLEKYDDARDHFREAMVLSRDDTELQNSYGIFLCNQGEYRDAERQLLGVLENPVYPDRAGVYENLGVCTYRGGRVEKAAEYLRQALGIDPQRPRALYYMATINFERGSYLASRSLLRSYQQVARHSPATLWLGIRLERILGDKDALASYELTLTNLYPDAEETRLYLESK